MYFMPRLVHARKALVLGDGDGRFLAALLAANKGVEATAIDSSSEMLRLLRDRCSAFSSRLKTVQMNALSFTPPQDARYDLVVSHFFLDCFTESQLNELIRRITPALEPGARWVVSDFRIPTGIMRLPGWFLVRSLYLAFSLLTGLRATKLPQYSSCLLEAGFTRIEQRLFLAGMLSAESWQFSERSQNKAESKANRSSAKA
jgi:ubiquinone/menaquinone biosynthesis C-methylase UbiE